MMFGSAESEHPRLTKREIIFEEFQPMWSQSTDDADGRTDDMRLQEHALHCSASRGKNGAKRPFLSGFVRMHLIAILLRQKNYTWNERTFLLLLFLPTTVWILHFLLVFFFVFSL